MQKSLYPLFILLVVAPIFFAGCQKAATVDEPASQEIEEVEAEPTDVSQICRERPHCDLVEEWDGEATASEGRSVVALALIDVDEDRGCDLFEYWLLDDERPEPVLLSTICNDGYGSAGLGRDQVVVEDGRFLHERSGGSNWRWSRNFTLSLDTLSFLNMLNFSTSTVHESVITWNWDFKTLTGTESHDMTCDEEGNEWAFEERLLPNIDLGGHARSEELINLDWEQCTTAIPVRDNSRAYDFDGDLESDSPITQEPVLRLALVNSTSLVVQVDAGDEERGRELLSRGQIVVLQAESQGGRQVQGCPQPLSLAEVSEWVFPLDESFSDPDATSSWRVEDHRVTGVIELARSANQLTVILRQEDGQSPLEISTVLRQDHRGFLGSRVPYGADWLQTSCRVDGDAVVRNHVRDIDFGDPLISFY